MKERGAEENVDPEGVGGAASDVPPGFVKTEGSLTPFVRQRLPDPVLVVDTEPAPQRRPEDLWESLALVLGIVLVLLLGVYAHSTTQGLAEDVQVAFGTLLRRIVLVPISVIEGLIVVIAPTAVIFALARRQRYRAVTALIATALVSAIIGWGLTVLIPHLPTPVADALVVLTPTGAITSVDPVVIVLAAAFTAGGESGSVKAIRYSWYGIWFILLSGVIRGVATVPGMLITVMLGRLFGCLARWIFGFNDRRATPIDLVEALLTVDIAPARVTRRDRGTSRAAVGAWSVTESPAQPDYASGLVHPTLEIEPVPLPNQDLALHPSLSTATDRDYEVETTDGKLLSLHVLDPGRAIIGTLGDLWNNLRLRGLSRWISPVLKANAGRAVLTSHVASSAGVRTPASRGIAQAGESLALIWQSVPPAVTLLALRETGRHIGEETLDDAWRQLLAAHSRGISHRNLDIHTLVVDEADDLWILDWDQGEVATGPLNQHIDRAQMLAHLALVTDPQRAFTSARRVFSLSELVAVSLVLQPAILPPALRSALRKTDVLETLRNLLAEIAEAAPDVQDVEPIRLQRFSLRTGLMITALLIIVFGVIGSLNFEAISEAVRSANGWWILGAFLIGSTTWLAAAIPLVAFAPRKISLFQTTISQVGASLTNVVAPAGVGPAAFSMRFLSKQGISVPLSVSTVTLVQISQFLTSVVLLLIVAVLTGTSLDIPIPTMTVIWVLAAILAMLAGVLAIPSVRRPLWARLKPTWEQVHPQLLWILGHPKELAWAIAGNLLGNFGYIGAFAASLAAFGYYLSPLTLTITFLVSTTVGSVVPSPGGIGPVEAALTGGLQVAGIPGAIAISTAVVYRLVTFYGRIPFGWVATRYLQRKDLI